MELLPHGALGQPIYKRERSLHECFLTVRIRPYVKLCNLPEPRSALANGTYYVAWIRREDRVVCAQPSLAHSLKCLQASRLLSQRVAVRELAGDRGDVSVEWRTSFNARPLNVQIQLK
jgi:hypothetical protein